MSFWTGTEWAAEPSSAPKRHARVRHAFEAVLEGSLVALLLVGLIAAPTFAARGGGKGGHATTGASPSLTVDPGQVRAGDPFDVSGCGFDAAQGNVIVTFTGGSWGSPLDGGCFTITGIPALSGDTLNPGSYPVTAFQYVNGRWRAVTSTTIEVVAG
jgi:hypothetical protein